MPDLLGNPHPEQQLQAKGRARCPLGRSGCSPFPTPSGNWRPWTGSCSRVATSSNCHHTLLGERLESPRPFAEERLMTSLRQRMLEDIPPRDCAGSRRSPIIHR